MPRTSYCGRFRCKLCPSFNFALFLLDWYFASHLNQNKEKFLLIYSGTVQLANKSTLETLREECLSLGPRINQIFCKSLGPSKKAKVVSDLALPNAIAVCEFINKGPWSTVDPLSEEISSFPNHVPASVTRFFKALHNRDSIWDWTCKTLGNHCDCVLKSFEKNLYSVFNTMVSSVYESQKTLRLLFSEASGIPLTDCNNLLRSSYS